MTRYLRLRKTAATFLVTSSLAMLAVAGISGAEEQIERTGNLASGSSASVLRMLVDTSTNRGFSLGNVADPGERVQQKLIAYDLEKLSIIAKVPVPSDDQYFGLSAELATVDESGGRIFFTPGNRGVESIGCVSGPAATMSLGVFDTRQLRWSSLAVPCTKGDQFKVQGLSFDAASGKMYAIGTPQGEWAPRTLTPTVDELGQTLLLRQMSITPTGLALDWEIDLRAAGCDRTVVGKFGAFVQRTGSDLISYCYGVRNSTDGSQGFALRVPLSNDQPVSATAPVMAAPTLPNDLYPLVDPSSGRMLLLTAGSANGTAVWVYQPSKETFAGVIASGLPSSALGTTYFGLNTATGRTYLLTSAGLLVADTRSSPLPSGLSFPLFDDLGNQGAGPYVAVAPKLNRLFIPVAGKGFAVVEDRLPTTSTETAPDPDRGTADVAEIEGKTSSVWAGAGAAFGTHVLMTGGVTRAINNTDPACYTLLSVLAKDSQGRCLSEQAATSGQRETFLGATQVDLGSQTGISAGGAGVAFPSEDTATDADFKRLGYCAEDAAESKTGNLAGYSEFCASTPLAPFAGGTRGTNGAGYPIPASSCEVFGDGKKTDSQVPGAAGPTSRMSSSSVTCDGANASVVSDARSAAFSLPDDAAPVLSVARTGSTTSSKRTSAGIETSSISWAQGVKLGDFFIGEITTEVTTVAHGRTGSNSATLVRKMTDVRGPGIKCAVCEPTSVIAAMNRALGLRVRATIPEASSFASPRGYQAVVVKDPELRDSDRTGNDDDTFAVSGLQIVLFNDGREGRSRLVVQLAGVQSESRYGIFPLPDESSAQFDEGSLLFDEGNVLSLPEFDVPPTTPSVGQVLIGGTKKLLAAPITAGVEAFKLIVNEPREAMMLFVLLSLLGSPVYLGIRRSFLRTTLGA